ncbi:hypothetical protein HG535_0A02560 [Zygotorulaspora mrakii]|uniref:Phosphatidate phosphatase APP1 catalytic domain-containing protein n=1 Tax=Zygotorulaspora mrakii TaxID=42260 RepID=A0A7H9AVE2_ZYGMR|nr:uncharacterized protein HG535_0A02560 [Zygotorulaspora mrakii]QLG70318.1 hypothetical protein HG535_0A02560 [Zygotorulaspora mrakii]
MNQYDRGNKSSYINHDKDIVNETTLGKRQRFFNLVKNTKDVYIPSITSTISQKTVDGFKRGINDRNEPQLNLPTDVDILFYPTYSTKVGEQFETTIRFSASSPGNPASRKNRLLFSLCKQLVKPFPLEELDDASSDAMPDDAIGSSESRSNLSSRSTSTSLNSSGQNSTSNSLPLHELDNLKERTLGFFARSVPNFPVILDILPEEGISNSQTITKTTDERGYLYAKVRTDFQPSSIRITLDTPIDFPKIISREYPCNYVKPEGYGIISDIDDTIKHTGVTGDKRSMFRNVFVNNIDTWLISEVSQWYKTLEEHFEIDFFYISNSPMQIYPVLQQYITRNFPKGPLFLKRYSGNLLSSIMTSSANRKILAIKQVFNDFPHKRFILVGDSGEQDFEAYINTAMQHPDQVVGIYIRCCKNSMSDMGLREIEVMRELNGMVQDEYLSPIGIKNQEDTFSGRNFGQKMNLKQTVPTPPPVPPKKPKLTAEQERTIRDSRAPPIPTRKPVLSAKQEEAIKESHLSSNASTENRTSDSIKAHPMQEPQDETDPMVYYTPSTQNDYGAYSTFFDKKADNWRNRVLNGIRELKHLKKNRSIRLMFFTKPDAPLKDCLEEIQQK